jgi:FMN phosphatase YigB (HAD superfamily)
MFFFWGLYFIKNKIDKALFKKSSLTHTISPQTTIIAFDIHGVLFAPDKKKIKKVIKSHPSVFNVLVYAFWPPFLLNVYKLVRKKAVPEEIINHLSSRYKLIAKHKQFAIQLANAQKHIPYMENLVTKLKDLGYELHIFSNIGSEIFKELSDQHYTLFKLFDKIYIPHRENNFIGKPHHQAFRDYLKRCNNSKQQVIFIDNRWRNIKSAHQSNIFGIHFKSAQQLTKELQQLAVIKEIIANPT